MAWHVYSYLTLGLPGCHFLNIFASKVSRKNKGKVSKFFGQSVTNDTSTPGWVPLVYSTIKSDSLLIKWEHDKWSHQSDRSNLIASNMIADHLVANVFWKLIEGFWGVYIYVQWRSQNLPQGGQTTFSNYRWGKTKIIIKVVKIISNFC